MHNNISERREVIRELALLRQDTMYLRKLIKKCPEDESLRVDLAHDLNTIKMYEGMQAEPSPTTRFMLP